MENVKRNLLTLFVVLTALVSTAKADSLQDAFKYETVKLPGTPFHLEYGDFHSTYLESKARFVKTIWVKAETNGVARVEVIANGSVMGTMRVDRNGGPATMINVREFVNSLEFRHISGDSVAVTEVIAVRSYATSSDLNAVDAQFAAPSDEWTDLKPGNSAAVLAKRAIELVEKLRPYVDPRTDYIDYLLPIKTTAGTAYSVAQAYGDGLSMQTRQAMKDLSFSIGQAQRIITDLMHIEACFDLSVELRSLKHEIDRRLI